MTDPVPTPIVVNPDPTMATLAVALRYAITTIGGYLVGKGWIDGDLLQVISSVLLVLGPAAYAAWRARRDKAEKVTLASATPDHVGIVQR